MSEVLENKETMESDSIESVTDAITNLLETLVPPKEIEIIDIFGDTYKVTSSVSARKQILILREFDKMKEISLTPTTAANGSMASIVAMIVDIAMNESVFEAICKCFYLAHPDVAEEARKKAKKAKLKIEDNHLGVGDLFSIEEIVAGIVPLFIRLARRTGTALSILSK